MGILDNLIHSFYKGGGSTKIEAPVALGDSETHMRWRLTEGDDTEWKNLKAWALLTGADGANGITPDLQKNSTHIQYKYGEGEWTNLVALSDITGPKGDAGTNGTNGTNGLGVPEGGSTGQVLRKKSNTDNDTEWADPSGGDGADVGDICYTYRQTAKTGYLLLDGREISKTTYADLYAVIGDIGGEAAEGNFKLPDHRERVAVPAKAGGTFATIGAKGGSQTHSLTTNEIQSHTHTYTGPGGPQVTTLNYQPGETPLQVMIGVIAGGTIDTGAAGGGAAHNNLQPYIVISTAQIKY